MNFQNDSGVPAIMARAHLLYRDLTMTTVVAKASFDVTEDGRVQPVPVAEQLQVSEADVETDLGTIDGDVVPIKPGCDIALLGHARSPRRDRPVDRLTLDLRAGSFARKIAVFGDRAWVDGLRSAKSTAPVPFTAIPLTYERAFGGSAILAKQLAAPYPQNPAGRGYVQLREHVAGTHLPNLEEADQLLSSWEQMPLSAGTAPLPRASSLRLHGDGFGVDLENELVQLSPPAFSFAHPRMRAERYPGGEKLTLVGATHDAPWKFDLPALDFSVSISLGAARYDLPMTIDTLCLFPDYRRFFVVARRAFVYQFLPRRPRSVSVVVGAIPSTGATTTIAEQRQATAPLVTIEPEATPEALPLPFDSLLPLYPLTRIVEGLPLCPSG